MKARE